MFLLRAWLLMPCATSPKYRKHWRSDGKVFVQDSTMLVVAARRAAPALIQRLLEHVHRACDLTRHPPFKIEYEFFPTCPDIGML